MAKKKEKMQKEPFNIKKELKLAPGYLVLFLWIAFTAIILGWILAASLSTTRDMFMGEIFKFNTGLHWENYARAWNTSNVAIFFKNSAVYATTSCVFIILISAPAAYALSRFSFFGNRFMKNAFVIAMSIPSIMIILPLYSFATKTGLTGSKIVLIFLYVGINIPFTTTFLMTFFGNLSKTYEEAAAIDGCSATKTFWKIMLPLAQPGIITVSIFNFLAVWNEYFMSLIFASKEANMSVGVGLFNIVSAMQYTSDYGGMFAAVIIVFLPTFIIYVFLSEKIIAGVTGGGIKG